MRALYSVLVLLLASCGGGGSVSIIGELDRSVSSVKGGNAYAIDAPNVDAVWAMPIYGVALGTFSLEEKIIVPIAADGSFEFTPPENGDYDYILALVDSTKCGTDKPRMDWTEADIDSRLQCIQGYVAVPETANDGDDSGAMTAMPTTQQTGTLNLGNLSAVDSYAVSEQTLDNADDSFNYDLDELKAIAKADNMLLSISYLYANRSDDFQSFYDQNLDFTWVANAGLDSAKNSFTSGDGLEITPFGYYFGGRGIDAAGLLASVQSTAGYLSFTPPADLTFQVDNQVHGPSNPIVSAAPGTPESGGWTDGVIGFQVNGDSIFGGLQTFTGGLPGGEWKISRGGEVVAKADLATSSPFVYENGSAVDTAPIVFVPSVMINTTGDVVDSVDMIYTQWNGTGFETVPFEVAVHAVGHAGFGFAGDSGTPCPNDNHERTAGSNGIEVLDDRLRWTPTGSWKYGASDATHCGLTDVVAGYNVSQNSFQFHWSVDGQIR
jgi:hypothetical protein